MDRAAPSARTADRNLSVDRVVFAAGAVETTRIGFGCAGLRRLPSAADRDAVLHAALDHGIRHFDVARMYGLGAAESDLGRFAASRRDALVIATKFGIDPPAGSARLARLQGPARRLLARYPALRRGIRARSGTLHPAGIYDAATARTSLETSLRELGMDHVDLLFLHAPTPDRVRTEDVCAFLETARQAGTIRAWGVSGEPEPTAAVMQGFPAMAVTQIHQDILGSPSGELAARGPTPVLTFGVLAAPLEAIRAHLGARPSRASAWSQIIGEDCERPETLASLLLRDAVRVNRRGTVLFATTKAARIAAATQAADGADAPDPALDAFRALVNEELVACS